MVQTLVDFSAGQITDGSAGGADNTLSAGGLVFTISAQGNWSANFDNGRFNFTEDAAFGGGQFSITVTSTTGAKLDFYDYQISMNSDPLVIGSWSPGLGLDGTTWYDDNIHGDGVGPYYYRAIFGGNVPALSPQTSLNIGDLIVPDTTTTGTISFWLDNITVELANQRPVAATSGGTSSFTEGNNTVSTPIAVDSGVTISDGDNTTLASATVSITGSFQSGQDVLAFTNTSAVTFGNIVASFNALTGVMTLTSAGGTATLAQWQSALRAVTYTNTSESPNTAPRTVSFVVNDGSDNSTVATKIVNVSAVDDAPIVSTSGGSTAFSEGNNTTSTPVAVDAGLTIADADNTTLTSATVAITGNFHGGEDVLAFTNSSSATFGNIMASYNGSTGVLTLASAGGSATVAQWQAALRAVTYTNSSETPDTSNRTVAFTTNDGTLNSSTVTKTVTVASTNDAPVLTTTGGSTAFTEGGSTVAVDGGVTLSDADNTTLAFATVAITGNFQSSQDVLAFANDGSTMGNITASYNAGTGVLTLTSAGGVATLAEWQAALRSVAYANTSETPGAATRTISFVANDGSTSSTAGIKTVTVTSVNDAPEVTVPGSISVVEDSTAAITGISFSDADAGGGSVTVTLSVGAGSLGATSGGGVTVGGTASSLTLTGSIANINAFIAASNLHYTTAANATGNVTLTAAISDNGNTGGAPQSDVDTVTLVVTPLNDVPVITAPGSIAVAEDAATTVTGISFADVDAGSASVTVSLTVPSGALAATSAGGVLVSGGGTGTLTLSGSITDINAFIAASKVNFVPVANATSDVVLTAAINDGGNSGTGGALTTTTTVTLVTTAINDAPVNHVPGQQVIDTNSTLVFSSGNSNAITVSDIDAGGGTVQVTLTASNGLISLAGTTGLTFVVGSGAGDAMMTFEGTVTDINAALNGMAFLPTAGYSGPATLQVITNDLGRMGSGGAQTDTDTIPINVGVTEVVSVDVTSADGVYHTGQTISVTVSFDSAVTVAGGTPTLVLETGSVDHVATYVSGSGSNTLTFKYTVQAGDHSTDLDYASIAALVLNGATIKDANGNDAVLTLPTVGGSGSIAGQNNIVIDGIAPSVANVAVPANGTYMNGDNLTFTVTFQEAVVVDTAGGAPRIAVTLDTGGTVYANYVGGSGTAALTFRLTVIDDQRDTNGITLGSALLLNGGTIRDSAGNNAVLTFNNVASTASVFVDGIVNDAPRLTGDLRATVAEGGSYKLVTADLGFTDPDDTAAGVTFFISSVTNGTVLVNGVAATRFTGTQLAGGLVSFRHNGSDTTAASFKVFVEDGNEDLSTPVSATFNFTVNAVNDAPTLTLTQRLATIAENASTATERKVADLLISDDGLGSNALTLAGADSSLFAVHNNALWLKAGARLDFETNPFLDVSVLVDDKTIGTGAEATKTVRVSVTDAVERYVGSSGANTLTGTSAANEYFDGGAGNDTINGGAGKDTIVGGLGADRLTGGAGNDTFVFNLIDDSAKGFSGYVNNVAYGPASGAGYRDIITDFGNGDDVISLTAIDANTGLAGNQAFTWRGTGAFTRKAGELIYKTFDAAGTANDKTIIYGDVTGDGRADFQIELSGIKALVAGDFLL
ncbi:beta strand repeat-containing protein [Sinorhizobium mexicanum]|uniref:Uncharacterized protein n=1 Tax=Sinorhizobium mexicanum TaxID=375549 RepID=A0A859QCH6_9HYPH|nr:cadherin-like domain-containing protein [Sinorhizobium mexicanum]MBP1882322.1 hypothetical protein [Sinorhizobium mexicanum]QLL62033.1 hypothetical protein FKV68_11485 [Sinorhizobium mexicanum]